MIKKLNKYDSFEGFINNLAVNGEHYIYLENNPYKFHINNIYNDCGYIIVGFTGAVTRSRSAPPYYSFRGISEKLGIGLLSISDPSLDLVDDLGLSWYVGNHENGDISTTIARFLDQVITITGKKLILCGGSGGGFAALNIQSLMKKADLTSSFVWNPQTDITKYNNLVLFKYLSSCYKENIKTVEAARKLLIKNEMKYCVPEDKSFDSLIMINGYDPNHIRKQVRRFIKLDGKSKSAVYFGNWGNGHVKPPKELIEKVLDKFISGKNAADISEFLRLDNPTKEVLIFYFNGNKLEDVLDVRATSVNVGESKIVILKSNIYDYFMGYNIKYSVIRKSKVLYETDYLLGIAVGEIVFEMPSDKNILNREFTIEIVIEDVLGVQKKYKYNLAIINNNLKVRSLKF